MILFYCLTDVWLLVLCILAEVELGSEQPSSYIQPLGWAISVPAVSLLLLLVWTVLRCQGWADWQHGRERRDHKKTVTNMSYSDYHTWVMLGSHVYAGFTVVASVLVVAYCARFSAADSRSLGDVVTTLSARVWNYSALSSLRTLAFFAFVFHSIATWKYWALVWSSADPRIFLNPFFPAKRMKFNVQ